MNLRWMDLLLLIAKLSVCHVSGGVGVEGAFTLLNYV